MYAGTCISNPTGSLYVQLNAFFLVMALITLASARKRQFKRKKGGTFKARQELGRLVAKTSVLNFSIQPISYIDFECRIAIAVLQSSVSSHTGSPSSSGSNLGIWYSHYQCQLHCICMAFHNLQLPPGINTYRAHEYLSKQSPVLCTLFSSHIGFVHFLLSCYPK